MLCTCNRVCSASGQFVLFSNASCSRCVMLCCVCHNAMRGSPCAFQKRKWAVVVGEHIGTSMSRFAGKVCVVTGGSAGIGLAVRRCFQRCCIILCGLRCAPPAQIAERMGLEGGHVVICSRRQVRQHAALLPPSILLQPCNWLCRKTSMKRWRL